MYNVGVLCWKHEVVIPLHDYMITEYLCDKYKYAMKFSSDDMVANFEE